MVLFHKNQSGFTLVEMIVVMGMMTILLGYATVNLTSIMHTTYVATTVDTLVSDLKQQQLKAMTGDTEGRSSHDHYGVHFDENNYELFHGSTYSASSTSSSSINYGSSIQLQGTTFPSSQVVFTGVTGEIMGFTPGANTITLRNSVTSEQRTIMLNRYGAITGTN